MSDLNKLADIFRGTIDPNERESAEKQLEMIYKIIGFTPSILRLVMADGVEMSIRQAAVIYLKNNVIAYWSDKSNGPGLDNDFNIHEADRQIIRDSIIDAIVMAPELISVHLAVCVSHIIKADFPGRWLGLVDKICIYLRHPDTKCWMGALLALYQLVKIYEYKTGDDRAPLDEAMNLLLPLIYQRCGQLLGDHSDLSICLQKQVLKIFHAFTQYSFPLKLISNEIFAQWMELFRVILERPKFRNFEQEREESNWWKCKKWVLHILSRVFERYGSPGAVSKEYNGFANFYIKTFSGCVIGLLLKILEQQGNKHYVDSRVLQLTLVYLSTAVNHAVTWKLIKPHTMLIVQNILFPLMCYTDEDDELWTTDPHEYIRMKFDVFEDYVSPVTAAQNLLHMFSLKRKEMLQKILAFVFQILNDSNSDARMIDGALHIVGSVADILLKKEMYKDQIEELLVTYVFPYFSNQHGYLRARACWVLNYFSGTRFQRDSNLASVVRSVEMCLMHDKELPVKVQAAICIQGILTSQDKAQKLMEPNITPISFEILNLLRETGNEDLTSAMQKLVCLYPEQMMPIAFEITQHLEQTFYQILDSSADEDNEDKAMTAMGLLTTIDTICTVMEDQKEIMAQLQPVVVRLVVKIYQEELMELYEEALTLVCTATTNSISPDLWKIYELMYQVFKKDAFEYFGDMMPALHNFITVDPQTFVNNRNHVLAMYDMCKTVLNNDAEEEAESYAAKLLECMILQFKGQIDECIRPFVELVLTRLTREVKNTSLQQICLQVIIAAFYYNPILLLNILNDMQPIDSNQSLFTHFINRWLSDIECFKGLHDRKICVLGLITLISLPPEKRVAIINEASPQLMPSILKLFDGLKLAYQSKANAENADEEDSEEELDEDSDVEALEDEEDHVAAADYHSRILGKINSPACPFPVTSSYLRDDEDISEDDEDEYSDDEEADFVQTALESYTTPLDADDTDVDEYVIFREVLEMLQKKDPNWYNVLMSPLKQEQQEALQSVFILASQRKAAAESRKIEKLGGYMFHTQTVPSSFNFGGTPIV
ncbi:importin-7 [Tetranychus urticae]|uniref:Importin N-terminal domain-containing protein n=1 Tax=Tetranychus urticae TaxID=32264 RepID=T1K060_TETUR|nr:importin-7 [Tetranychus urticae]